VQIIDLGITDFLEAYRFQIDLLKKVSEGKACDTLLITEHRPIITVGRRGSWSNILRSKEYLSSNGVEIFNADRGGDVTYHGPGQIVTYPIFKLRDEGRDIHKFLQFLEAVGKDFLVQYGLEPESGPGSRGIWIRGKKIGSIGIGVKKWVTYHGLAMNINMDLSPFLFIKPCGIEGVEMTSLKSLLHRELDMNDAKDKLKLSFKRLSLLAQEVSKN